MHMRQRGAMPRADSQEPKSLAACLPTMGSILILGEKLTEHASK